jgi:very-short-patch-repair endonuclease
LAGPMTPEQILQSSGGVARTSTLLQRGAGERAIERSIDDGRILRIRRGVLALPGAPPDLVRALAAGARLTCLSAATHYGLWCVRPSSVLHVSRAGRSAEGCINHRGRSVPPHPRMPLVGLADVLVHVLQCRPPEESVPVVECALRRGATTAAFVGSRLRGPFNGVARAALASVDLTGESAIEVVARLLLRGAGLDVRPQVHIAGVGRVDFLVEGHLIVEIDGAAFHSDRQALRRDRRRNNMTVIGGYLVLRFCYEDVMFQPDDVLAMVLAALGRRPVR